VNNFILPHDLQAEEDALVEATVGELQDRGTYNEATDGPLVRQYASNMVESQRLTAEVRRHDPTSQEHRRLSSGRDRSSRLAAMYAAKLKLGGVKKTKTGPSVTIEQLKAWLDEPETDDQRTARHRVNRRGWIGRRGIARADEPLTAAEEDLCAEKIDLAEFVRRYAAEAGVTPRVALDYAHVQLSHPPVSTANGCGCEGVL
jgi:hypothetical protein